MITLYRTNVGCLGFITKRCWTSWKSSQYPLHWSKTSMPGHLIDSSNALCQSHVYLFFASSVGLFDHFVQHVLECRVSPFDSANLFRRLQRCWIDSYAVLTQGLIEHSAIVCSAINCDKLRPSITSHPSFVKVFETIGTARYTVVLANSHYACLLQSGAIVDDVQDVVECTCCVLDFEHIDTNFMVEGVRFRW